MLRSRAARGLVHWYGGTVSQWYAGTRFPLLKHSLTTLQAAMYQRLYLHYYSQAYHQYYEFYYNQFFNQLYHAIYNKLYYEIYSANLARGKACSSANCHNNVYLSGKEKKWYKTRVTRDGYRMKFPTRCKTCRRGGNTAKRRNERETATLVAHTSQRASTRFQCWDWNFDFIDEHVALEINIMNSLDLRWQKKKAKLHRRRK